ncbi:MAG: hypothetical protein HYR84_01765 [Planctomycetes bacterium]|nr:hypothetical protein [Planctomycetota bacterium]
MNRVLYSLAFLLTIAPIAGAQGSSFRSDLLGLLPDDFAVCVVMHDLRGNADRWDRSDWLKTFRQSPLVRSYLDAPEIKQLERWQAEMKSHIGLDWPTLRDDILGDTVILAYAPGPKNKPEEERGLILVHVQKPAQLVQVVDKLNDAMIKAKKLEVTALEYKGTTYYRRQEKNKTQYYVIRDSLAAIASKEETLRAFLDRRAAPPRDNVWAKRFQRAGADSAFLTMCVNPRALDAEVLQAGRKDDPLAGYWKGLDAIFFTAAIRDEAELRIVIQANPDKLPPWAKTAFTQTMPASALWQRFPERTILTVAAKTDFAGAVDALKMLMSKDDQSNLQLLHDYLPNIGPDWGLCILPAKDAKALPQAMFALAVRPGDDKRRVDETLYHLVEFFTGIVVRQHNEKNPNAPIRIETIVQDKVEVRFLSGDKLFPAGLRPACALKDGYLIFATSPEAIAHFRFHEKRVDDRAGTPIVRVSATELARLLEQRRDHILGGLTEKDAAKNLDNVISALGLFDHLTLTLHGGAGQATWSIRLAPAPK